MTILDFLNSRLAAFQPAKGCLEQLEAAGACASACVHTHGRYAARKGHGSSSSSWMQPGIERGKSRNLD
ncbi:hypothetical protein Y1Q_0005019 [Alligator mississippiensis]|uniref:Uncharacterized protein n=1 Tax=Alligator mississippiensis TaxID=8496 RepID=A0A151M3N2_ALLMI|nr:hypothetical protein Y1Q_0005019 [Alligator mississippiensis]